MSAMERKLSFMPSEREYILEGEMQFIVHENMQLISERAVNARFARLENRDELIAPFPVKVTTRENLSDASWASAGHLN